MEKNKNAGEVMETVIFKITGMCSCEFKIIEKKMKTLAGIKEYTLNPVTNQMKVTYDRSLQTVEGIQKAVAKAGGTATIVKSNQII